MPSLPNAPNPTHRGSVLQVHRMKLATVLKGAAHHGSQVTAVSWCPDYQTRDFDAPAGLRCVFRGLVLKPSCQTHDILLGMIRKIRLPRGAIPRVSQLSGFGLTALVAAYNLRRGSALSPHVRRTKHRLPRSDRCKVPTSAVVSSQGFG